MNIICLLFGHKLVVKHHIRGDINHGTRLIYCPRCRQRFIMSDAHEAVLRYDNDHKFIEDLLSVYSELRLGDLCL